MADRAGQPSDERTTIGDGTFVRGRIQGSGDLEIAGRVEGDVDVAGDVVVETTGLVSASISARRIVVRGSVKGDLIAEEAVLLEGTARVVGDLRAPRIAIAPGGLVRGQVQTGPRGQASPRTRAASVSDSKPRTSAHTNTAMKAAQVIGVPTQARTERVETTREMAAPSVPAQSNGTKMQPSGARAGGSMVAGRLGPPPPVVPALKKGTKAIAHHKKR